MGRYTPGRNGSPCSTKGATIEALHGDVKDPHTGLGNLRPVGFDPLVGHIVACSKSLASRSAHCPFTNKSGGQVPPHPDPHVSSNRLEPNR
jgi:hypothetical protein